MTDTPRAPVILIGMHRSGTSMLTRVLGKLGLFVGAKVDSNEEAIHFLKTNKWILRQAGIKWDHPEQFAPLLESEELRALIVDQLRELVKSPATLPFLGPVNALRYRDLHNLDFAWGWKDPRNTLTLPLWLDVFPDARVIHVRRHGADVARSLNVRAEREFHNARPITAASAAKRRARDPPLRFTNSLRCHTMDGAFEIWEDYVETAEEHVAALGSRALEVRYEDVLLNPEPHLRALADFCGLEVDEDHLRETATMMDPEKAYRYRRNPELRAFTERVAGRLAPHGY